MAKKKQSSKIETPPVTVAQHEDLIEFSRVQCRKVRVKQSFIPQSRAVDSATAKQMAEAAGAEADALSLALKLFNRSNPFIKELRGKKADVENWLKRWTVPTIDPGVREIVVAQIPDFEAGLALRRDQLYVAARAAQEQLPDLVREARKMHGKAFVESHYEIDFAERVKVLDPAYSEYTVARGLPEHVAQREIDRIRREIDEGIEKKVEDTCKLFQTMFENLSIQLVTRTYLDPKRDAPRAEELRNAEVKKVYGPALRLDVPEGHVLALIVRDGQKQEETLGPLPEEEYKRLYRPVTSDERRKLSDSVMENVFQQLRDFRLKMEQLGAYGQNINTALDAVREVLSGAGAGAKAALDEARDRKSNFRFELAETLDGVQAALLATSVEVKQVRRRIILPPAATPEPATVQAASA